MSTFKGTSRRISRAGIRLENMDGGGTDVEINIDADEQHGDGADAAMLEMQDAVGESNDNDASVDELENTVTALESLLETAEASQETGGLDPVAAELLQKAVENETAPLGTPAEEVVPALENFSSASGRRQATVMACEGIKEWIDKVWAKIQEMIQKGRDLMKKAYIAVKQAVQRLEQRVKGLKTDLGNRNFSLPKAGNVELGDDTWVVGQNDVKKLKDFVNSVLGTYATAAISHAKAVASALSSGDAKKVVEEGGKEGGGAAGKDEKKEEFTVPKDLQASFTAVAGATGLPGGRQAVVGGDTISIQVDAKLQSGKHIAKPLAEAELSAILGALEEVAKQVVAFEKNFQEKDRAEEGVLKAGKEFAKKAKDNNKGDDSEVRLALNTARDAARLLNQPIKDTLSYSATAINGICGFVAANLKMYDKK